MCRLVCRCGRHRGRSATAAPRVPPGQRAPPPTWPPFFSAHITARTTAHAPSHTHAETRTHRRTHARARVAARLGTSNAGSPVIRERRPNSRMSVPAPAREATVVSPLGTPCSKLTYATRSTRHTHDTHGTWHARRELVCQRVAWARAAPCRREFACGFGMRAAAARPGPRPIPASGRCSRGTDPAHRRQEDELCVRCVSCAVRVVRCAVRAVIRVGQCRLPNRAVT